MLEKLLGSNLTDLTGRLSLSLLVIQCSGNRWLFSGKSEQMLIILRDELSLELFSTSVLQLSLGDSTTKVKSQFLTFSRRVSLSAIFGWIYVPSSPLGSPEANMDLAKICRCIIIFFRAINCPRFDHASQKSVLIFFRLGSIFCYSKFPRTSPRKRESFRFRQTRSNSVGRFA